MSTKESNIVKQGKILGIGFVIVYILTMVYRILISKILGEEAIGTYSTVFEVYMLVFFVSCYGIPEGVGRLISKSISKKGYQRAKQVFYCSFFLACVIGGILGISLFVGAGWIEKHVLTSFHGIGLCLKIFAPVMLISFINGVLRGFFRGYGTNVPTVFSQILEPIFAIIWVIILPFIFKGIVSKGKDITNYGPTLCFIGLGIGVLFSFFFMIFLWKSYYGVLKRKVDGSNYSQHLSLKEGGILSCTSVLPFVLSMVFYKIHCILDSLLLHWGMGRCGFPSREIAISQGIYSNQYRLVTGLPIAITIGIVMCYYPKLLIAFRRKNKSQILGNMKKMIKHSLFIAIPSTIGLMVLAEPISCILFSNLDYRMGSRLLLLGATAIIFYSLAITTTATLHSIERKGKSLFYWGISLGVHLLLVALLIHFTEMRVFALVIGNVIYPLSICILHGFEIKRCLGYQQEMERSVMLPFIMATVMGALTVGIYNGVFQLLNKNGIAVIIAVVFGTLLYAGGMLLVSLGVKKIKLGT